MKEIKKLTMRFFFVAEIVLFLFYYFFGTHGIAPLMALEEQNETLKRELLLLKSDIKHWQKEVDAWHQSSFNREKFAREHLQMAYRDEELYRYPKF
jgi:cell division protein FtsB